VMLKETAKQNKKKTKLTASINITDFVRFCYLCMCWYDTPPPIHKRIYCYITLIMFINNCPPPPQPPPGTLGITVLLYPVYICMLRLIPNQI